MGLYLLTFLGGFATIAAFIGLGSLLNTVIFSKKYSDPGLLAVFGIGLFLTLGGYLNAYAAISKASLLGILAIGLVISIVRVVRGRNFLHEWIARAAGIFKYDKKVAFLCILVISIVLFRYALSVSFFDFHGTDDAHGYLAFPAKMIQTGQLGNDPFSERRIASSLGGGYLLHAAVLSFASFKNLHVVDNGIGFLLLIMLMWGLLQKIDLDKKTALYLVLVTALIPSPSGNVTSFFLSAALFFALFRLVYEKGYSSPMRSHTAVLLLVASLIAIKTNLIIPAVVLYGWFLFDLLRGQRGRGRLSHGVLAGGIFIGSLLPWMISMYRSSGTLLYPFLGKGFYGTQYGNFDGHFLFFNMYSGVRLASELISSFCLFIPLAALCYLAIGSGHARKRQLIQIISGCLLGIAAIIYGVGGYSLYYYTFPFVLPTVLIVLIALLDAKEDRFRVSATSALLVLTFLFGVFVQKSLEQLDGAKRSISFDRGIKIGLMNTDITTPEEFDQYRRLQLSVPPHETILARLDRNFLFDFKRNTIFIIDLPGGASLPPGLPFKQGGERMAEYLVSVGVRYVAYSYGNEANFTKAANSGMLRAHVNPWLKTETEHSFDFQDNLIALSKTRKIVYDDGKNFVLDLLVKQ